MRTKGILLSRHGLCYGYRQSPERVKVLGIFPGGIWQRGREIRD